MAAVTFEQVGKTFLDGTRAVNDLSLEVQDGEFLVLVGPSGCGKTTALRMVAGLEEISDGTISIGGTVVNELTPKERDVAMVFQNYALYPHLNVGENIGFGLRLRKTPNNVINERVAWAARMLGMTPYLNRRPKELSGGQRQRVAMGRAIVREPRAFLMDEPLSNLDAKLRVQMRAEISRLQHELGVTTIYVTHDQVEAMTMGDRVAVMRKGELQQVAEPKTLYESPENLFVASFIGSPAMNLLEAEVGATNGAITCRIGAQALSLPDDALRRAPRLREYAGRTVAIGLRPEHLDDAGLARDGATAGRLRGTVKLTEALGSEVLAHVEIAGKPVLRDEVLEGVVEELEDAVVVEDMIGQEIRDERTVIVGRFDAGSTVAPGDEIEVAVATAKLHFFDLETGEAIRA